MANYYIKNTVPLNKVDDKPGIIGVNISPDRKLIVFMKIIKYLVLIIWTFIVLFPLVIILFTSLKTNEEYVSTSVFALPRNFLNFENFVTAFNEGNLVTAFRNSFILVIVSSLVSVTFGSMTAYCMNRFDFWFKKPLYVMYLSAAIIPSTLLQVSIYGFLVNIGLVGTLFAPILIYLTTDVIQLWIYMQFMENTPKDIDESAMIEGATYFRIFISIIVPMLMPATATVLILKSITVYNDMFTQVLYMSKTELLTATTALTIFSGNRIDKQNLMTAAVILIMIPTILIFIFLQRYIFEGIAKGAVKD